MAEDTNTATAVETTATDMGGEGPVSDEQLSSALGDLSKAEGAEEQALETAVEPAAKPEVSAKPAATLTVEQLQAEKGKLDNYAQQLQDWAQKTEQFYKQKIAELEARAGAPAAKAGAESQAPVKMPWESVAPETEWDKAAQAGFGHLSGEFKSIRDQNAELQKQVQELMGFRDHQAQQSRQKQDDARVKEFTDAMDAVKKDGDFAPLFADPQVLAKIMGRAGRMFAGAIATGDQTTPEECVRDAFQAHAYASAKEAGRKAAMGKAKSSVAASTVDAGRSAAEPDQNLDDALADVVRKSH